MQNVIYIFVFHKYPIHADSNILAYSPKCVPYLPLSKAVLVFDDTFSSSRRPRFA